MREIASERISAKIKFQEYNKLITRLRLNLNEIKKKNVEEKRPMFETGKKIAKSNSSI